MANERQDKKIAFLVREQDVERRRSLWEAVWDAWEAVRNAGGTPNMLYNSGRDDGEVEAPDHLPKNLDEWKRRSMRTFVNPSASDYHGLVLPSSVVNLDFSPMDQDAESFAEQFLQLDGPTLVIVFKKRSM